MTFSPLELYEQRLAPYAQKSTDSVGRVYREQDSGPAVRSAFQRDRDRIVHSAAFRRLAYKTQVFVNHAGDYYRSRLTHTLEVAQVARTIARSLQLNEDLTEAVVLAHDLGHAPFGHAGQDVLSELMREHGHFEHNRQSLRIVDLLERRYAAFPGLNLSYETRECILKHKHRELRRELGFAVDLRLPLEGQIADLADSIAYDQHDVDDALKAKLIRLEDLDGLALWQRAMEHCKEVMANVKAPGQIAFAGQERRILRREAVRFLIGLQVRDVIETSQIRLAASGIKTAAEAQKQERNLIALSDELAKDKRAFQDFLMERVYRHHRVLRTTAKARRFLTLLFEEFVREPRLMPPEQRSWVDSVGLERAVCDYIAGMTDRYAQREYSQLVEPFVKT